MNFTFWIRGAAATALIVLAACSGNPGAAGAPSEKAAAPAAMQASPKMDVGVIASGLGFPWGIAFLPDGAMLVTEREGRLRIIRNGQLDPKPIGGVPKVFVDHQGGLFDVVLHPKFAENNLVYLSFAGGTNAANATRIIRARFDGTALADVKEIFRSSPDKAGGAHFGGRMLFLPDGTLLMPVGEGFAYREKAQGLDTDLGKIIRINDDGAIPSDNPFVGKEGARKEIWSYGHRNPQGILRDPETGVIYAVEHGPQGGDELNRIEPGKNYGWPVITYGVDYTGAQITPYTERPGMEQPLAYWVPSIATSGAAIYTGDLFPAWKGDIFIAALAGSEVRRVHMAGGKPARQESLFKDQEVRFRHVAQGPDGALYLLTDDLDGKVLKVTPAK
jgi:glucose/arabinose dehydrogenase